MLALLVGTKGRDKQAQPHGDASVQGPEHQASQISQRPETSPSSSLQDADGWAGGGISPQRLWSATAFGSFDLETASLGFILLRHAPSSVTGALQHYGEEQYLDGRRV